MMARCKKRQPGKKDRLAHRLGRIALLWLTLLAVGSTVSTMGTMGVMASEGDSVGHVPSPDQAQSDPPRTRWVPGTRVERMEILHHSQDTAGPVTVVTGFRCDQNNLDVCELLKNGEFTEVIKIYRDRISKGEDSVWIRCGLANALFIDGDLLGAARAYTWAASEYPNHPDVRNGLGNIFARLDQLQEAEKEFRGLASEDGYRAIALNNLGNVLRLDERRSEALAAYREANRIDPSLNAALFNRAGLLLSMEEYEQAARLFRQTAHLSPDFADAYFFEGLSHMGAQAPILAAPALFRARELGLDIRPLNLALGIACQELGLDGEGVSHLERAVSQDPADARGYQLLSVSLVRLGRLGEAAEVLQKGFLHGPQDAEAHFFLGLKLFLCEQPEQAADHFMRSAALGRRKADTFFALGQSLLQAGHIRPAIRALTLAAQKSPQASEIHFALAIALVNDDDLPGAVREMKTATSLDPEDEDTRLVLMDLLRRTGDFRGCAYLGKQLVNENPELVSTRFDTALCHALADDLDRAAETMEDAMDHDIEGEEVIGAWNRLSKLTDSKLGAPGPHLLLALIHERRGNWSEAVKSLERFILVSPSKNWTRRAIQKIHDLIPQESTTCQTCRAGP